MSLLKKNSRQIGTTLLGVSLAVLLTLSVDSIQTVNAYSVTGSSHAPTQVAQTGTPVPITLYPYAPAGSSSIQHIGVYMNLNGLRVTDSDTYILYERNQPVQVSDPHHFFSDVQMSIEPKGKRLQVTFTVTFAKPMKTSDLIINAWDTSLLHPQDLQLQNALEVINNNNQFTKV